MTISVRRDFDGSRRIPYGGRRSLPRRQRIETIQMPKRPASAPRAKPRVEEPPAPAAARRADAGAIRARKPKLSRVEKSERTRNAILQAAAEIIGEYGYADASIARIMERAGFGHGTFYAYFDSRAELFDQLLPLKGIEVLDLMHERVKGSADLVDMEYRGFLGFLEFAQEHPWFFRLLHEAEVAAPDAHRRHMENIMARFRRALRRSWDRGELPGYEQKELDTLAYLLISARDYVYSQHVGRSADVSTALRDAVQTYRKFISFGLRGKA